MKTKQYTALDLLQQLLQSNNRSSTIIVSRAALEAIIKQLQKEQHLVQDNPNEFSDRSCKS